MAKQNNNKKLTFLWALIPILAGAAFIAYGYKKQKKANTPNNTQVNPGNSNTPAGCTFPLKKGSVNNCVRQLQLALMAKYGVSILPQYGADGNWGNETQTAVQTATGQSQINTAADLNIILNNLGSNAQGVVGAEVGSNSWWIQ